MSASAEEIPQLGLLLRFDAGQELEVVTIPLSDVSRAEGLKGLVLWSDQHVDRWKFLDGSALAAGFEEDGRFGPLLTQGSRGGAADAGSAAALGTAMLDQLIGQTVVRGEGFLTPTHGGHHLQGAITLRRLQEKEGPPFPADRVRLFQDGRHLLDIPFPQGRQTIRWSEIASLPPALRAGLAPGVYTLRDSSGGKNTEFTIEDSEERNYVMQIPDALADLAGTRDSALYFTVTAEHLLANRDVDGVLRPYLADVLDLAEAVPEERRGQHQRSLVSDLTARLAGKKLSLHAGNATGIPEIDQVRQQIARSQWAAARTELQSLVQRDEVDDRTLGLAFLYLAVIEAEAAAEQSYADSATQLFEEALLHLQDAPAFDRFRAHNNFANFLLAKAQDRLYNHAFQAASGVENPLLKSFLMWQQAREQYEAALRLEDDLTPGQTSATKINYARLYALLSDLLRTLRGSEAGGGFAQAEVFASTRAVDLANAAMQDSGSDELTRAAGYELLAHLQFRAGRFEDAAAHTQKAIALYGTAGSLPGLESAHRTLGMCKVRQDGAATQKNDDALNSLLISQLITEVLRDRVQDESEGQSRSAFFARRAWVSEQIISQYIARKQPREALRFAELAKARALQDFLTAGRVPSDSSEHGDPPDLEDVLANWPEGTVALEYFLGSEAAWVFVVSNAEVRVFPLIRSGDSKPVRPHQFVAELTDFLSGMTFTAQNMLRTYQSQGGFDQSWQQDLHQFYQTLIPEAVRTEVSQCENLVIVPHHVLHYFPFAAMVTRTDPDAAEGFATVLPHFLVEDGMSVSYEPSLTAWTMLRESTRPQIQNVNAVGIAQFENATPLPGVDEDLANLKEAFGDRLKQLIERTGATETRVAELLEQPGMLFIATHGMNVADQPLDSFLLCHRDADADGRLMSAEIFRQKVGSDLVVMSACFSGLAERSPLPGDDMFGLQRAFLQSGACTVVSGLWDVYDGTGPLLMKSFFQELNRGLATPQALSEAQRKFIAERRAGGSQELWIHPYFWAVYTSAGSDLTRIKPNSVSVPSEQE
ncbi:CHAT domain-containing protein [Lignipirellula cremea]|uniref:CHAT domain-containing protein n=1 Tax=Lignipirellula cremea TaxID=2528010 RepID=UPI0018D237E5|nr:CHAT domain-containing protein [Lignipirellula cremea]